MMIYLGIFAALEELGKKPDLLIASCGGAFAATVINNFSDNFSRKEYLKSEEYFEFVRKTRLTKEKKLSKTVFRPFDLDEEYWNERCYILGKSFITDYPRYFAQHIQKLHRIFDLQQL